MILNVCLRNELSGDGDLEFVINRKSMPTPHKVHIYIYIYICLT
jgi:hypothetical protein